MPGPRPGWAVAEPISSPAALRTITSRGVGAGALCSAATRHAQPTTSVSTATPATTASQMRRYRRREKAENKAMA